MWTFPAYRRKGINRDGSVAISPLPLPPRLLLLVSRSLWTPDMFRLLAGHRRPPAARPDNQVDSRRLAVVFFSGAYVALVVVVVLVFWRVAISRKATRLGKG